MTENTFIYKITKFHNYLIIFRPPTTNISMWNKDNCINLNNYVSITNNRTRCVEK